MRCVYTAPATGLPLLEEDHVYIRAESKNGSVIEIWGDVEEFNVDIGLETRDAPDSLGRVDMLQATGRQFIQFTATGVPEQGPVHGTIRSRSLL